MRWILLMSAVYLLSSTDLKIAIPKYPITAESLHIEQDKDLLDWTEADHRKQFQLMHQITDLWEKKKFVAYGNYKPEKTFKWKMIPMDDDGWIFWKQLKVIGKILFGSDETDHTVTFSHALSKQTEKVKRIAKGNDAFCQQDVIEKQTILEGKHVYLLYNYAPLAKHHFMIIPKQHCTDFYELNEDEYLETAHLTQKLIQHYKANGYPNVHIYHKNGKQAGQTVLHWHQHLVFTATKTDEIFALFHALKKMILGSISISEHELKTRVKAYKTELSTSDSADFCESFSIAAFGKV